MSPVLFFIIFFTCTGVGKIFLPINSAAVAFVDILIAGWEGLKVVWSTWGTSTHQCIKTANIQIKIQHWDEARLVPNSKTNTETLEQQKPNSYLSEKVFRPEPSLIKWNPSGPKQRQSNLSEKVFRPEPSLIESPDPQLKRASKLSTEIGLTAKHAFCRITFMLYPVVL